MGILYLQLVGKKHSGNLELCLVSEACRGVGEGSLIQQNLRDLVLPAGRRCQNSVGLWDTQLMSENWCEENPTRSSC